MKLKAILCSLPGAAVARRLVRSGTFRGSADYWESRYHVGGTSGSGSYNRLAHFKADYLNRFVEENDVRSVVEFGSGDGAQLELARYPDYVGIDVSSSAIEIARRRLAGRAEFRFLSPAEAAGVRADLALSLDVIYHLVEDEVFDTYMERLFDAATRFVIVYSSDVEAATPFPHIRHRTFTDWVSSHRPDFVLSERLPNAYPWDEDDPEHTSFADFFVYRRVGDAT